MGRQGPRGLHGRPHHYAGLIILHGEDIQDASMSLVLSSCTIGQGSRTDRADMRVADNKASGDPLLEDLPAVNIRVIVQHVV